VRAWYIYGYGNNNLTWKWLNVAGSVSENNLKASNAMALLFKSSIGKTDRFLKSGRV